MNHNFGSYAGGTWSSASTPASSIEVINPTTERVIAHVAIAAPSAVDQAVAAARDALPGWSNTPVSERAAALRRIGDAVAKRQQRLTEVITQEVGTPHKLSSIIQVGLPMSNFGRAADTAEQHEFSEEVGNSLVLQEPRGIVACITPWNFPLHQLVAKVAYALAAGCTVVAKPSELTPLSAIELTEAIDEAGLPPGVFNLVLGGPAVGEHLVGHPGIDLVSFTGSPRAGRSISELASRNLTPVALELGGKSPNVILADADLEKAIPDALNKCFMNSGQTCTALTRLIVPEDRLDEVEELAAEGTAKWRLGDPFDKATRLGPVISKEQQASVRGYITRAIDQGARLIAGGPDQPGHLPRGFFVQPTIFSDVKPDFEIAQEEVFGPVLSILSYRDEDEAIRIANGTRYGLSAGVWSADPARADKVSRLIRAGQVDINGAPFNPLAPFGGSGMSGYGREFGRHGLQEFLAPKAIQKTLTEEKNHA
ncbi:aldehyde dehydrogenase family protein [Arthrobacter crystallopoietes]|uniref:aldehyde dehydrogenase family protein n=1 Tax=Crystallibacter crystallopoietes TaxID=37928 RepID=UPI00111126A0|nr:aldehyde dehydrogenase family protein [Arthrobacter crystallopoietes]